MLANSLIRLLDAHPVGMGITEANIDEALGDLHACRFERAKMVVRQGNLLQQIATQQFWGADMIIKLAVKLLGRELFLGRLVGLVTPAPRIKRLPVTKMRRAIPFDDELPAEPLRSTRRHFIVQGVVVLSLGVLVRLLAKSPHLPHSSLPTWSWKSGAAAVLPGLPQQRMAGRVLDFTAQMIPALVVWMVEGNRMNNKLSPTRWYVHSIYTRVPGLRSSWRDS